MKRWLHLLFILPLPVGLILSLYVKNAGDGLPLDDAYIYLQYIKNIVAGKGFCFNPGDVSFGVTSFLYTIFSALVDWVVPFVPAMGAMQWAGIFWFLVLIYFSQLLVWQHTKNLWLALWVGIMLAGCRPLYFTAPAGLEASMFCAIAVINFYLMLRHPWVSSVWLGFAGGLLFLTRPEGLIAAAGYIFFQLHAGLLLRHRNQTIHLKTILNDIIWYGLGWLLVVSPYMVFVKINSGFWLPTTFYGKLLHLNDFTTFPLSIQIKEGFIAILNAVREIADQDPTAYIYYVLFFLSAISALIFTFNCGQRMPSNRCYAARAAMLGVFALPFLFGFKFHVYPQFGGYFVRYIQILIVLIHIESAFALHYLLTHIVQSISNSSQQKWSYHAIGIALSAAIIFVALPVLRRGAPDIPKFFTHHIDINEGVRKQTAYWLRDHTPVDARILIGTTGLGVVGGYCERYCKDEAGLINPDIHLYLKAFTKRPGDYGRMREDHWAAMLKYMKLHNLRYYTSYQPVWFDTRFTKLAAKITDPSKTGTEVEDLASIYIYRYDPKNQYNLWSIFDEHLEFEDLATHPINEGRVKLTFWDDIPVIAVDVRMVKSEISGEYIFPENALFTASLALDYPNRTYHNEWIEFQVEVETFGQREVVYNERFNITDFTPRETLKEITIDLSDYSNQYGKLILSQIISPKKDVGILWSGWVNPRLNSNENAE